MTKAKPWWSYIPAVLRGLFSCIWLFVPSLIFLVLTIVCFWYQSAGQDIMMAFAERDDRRFRIFFFLALAFWTYLNWFASRIIGYTKHSPTTGVTFRHDAIAWFRAQYPRAAGYAGLAIFEVAILRLPVLKSEVVLIDNGPWLLFLILVISILADTGLSRIMAANKTRWTNPRIYLVFVLPLVVLLALSLWADVSTANSLWLMFAGVWLMHIFFLFYVNRRRVVVDRNINRSVSGRWRNAVLTYFDIPSSEIRHLIALVIINLVCGGVYIAIFNNIRFAQWMGPLTTLLLGFSFLLALADFITVLSVRWKLNLHFLALLLAIFVSNHSEKHAVRQISPGGKGSNEYATRPRLDTYLKYWLQRVPRDLPKDSLYDVWFVLSDGGASRSGYWTANVLGRMEDESRRKNKPDPFSAHLFSLSGASGGEVGLTTFFSLLKESARTGRDSFETSARTFLGKDYFSFTAARLLGPDYFGYLSPFRNHYDRARGLEESFERSDDTGASLRPAFGEPFSGYSALNEDQTAVNLPLLFINTTRMQDGIPGIVTNLRVEPNYFGARVDVLQLLKSDSDISLASAAILGARFPYVSPAGNINNNYFVDGGYFDNSGAGVTQELIRGILWIYKNRCPGGAAKNPVDSIYSRIGRLRFNVLHITNSPIGGQARLERVGNLDNDLFAPFQTLLGAYDMQTAFNDRRFDNYLADLERDSVAHKKYYRISLYPDPEQDASDTAPPNFNRDSVYSMNWFISQSAQDRMCRRLDKQPVLRQLLGK